MIHLRTKILHVCTVNFAQIWMKWESQSRIQPCQFKNVFKAGHHPHSREIQGKSAGKSRWLLAWVDSEESCNRNLGAAEETWDCTPQSLENLDRRRWASKTGAANNTSAGQDCFWFWLKQFDQKFKISF